MSCIESYTGDTAALRNRSATNCEMQRPRERRADLEFLLCIIHLSLEPKSLTNPNALLKLAHWLEMSVRSNQRTTDCAVL